MKLWGGRFNKETDASVEEFTASIHFDQRLWKVDILGTLAHVKALEKASVLTTNEVAKINDGLAVIEKNISNNAVNFSIADEDIHMNIERLLANEIGELAGKVHTGRSRNDQVALDLHLYLREQILCVLENIFCLQNVLFQQAQQHIDAIMPGYTHLQHAQPIRFSHHLLAYFSMLQRDAERLISSWPHVNKMPLGAGAIAGNSFNLDRHFIAKLLNFDEVYENSMDAVSDRDFIAEVLFTTSMIMMHLSRFSEDIILWCTHEFSFIELDDAYCTGSSMMPQKKNPDVAELVRGKTGRVYGGLVGILTVLKSLPLTYNKDLQEDKENLFDALSTVNNCLQIFSAMISTMKINKDKMLNSTKNNFSTATALADYLVKKGMPFREAHKVIGVLVMDCLNKNLLLTDLTIAQLNKFSELFTPEVIALLNPEYVVETYDNYGGTAKSAVLQQLETAKNNIFKTEHWLNEKKNQISPSV